MATYRFEQGVLSVLFTGPGLAEREVSVISCDLREAIDAVGGQLRVLVLDFRDVAMVSSMGLGMCIETRNHAKDKKARTVVYGLDTQLTKLFRMMKINRL